MTALRRLVAVLLLLATALADAAPPSFREPGIDTRPLVRWWWPPIALSDAELERELRELADAGFGGVELAMVRPREGIATATSDPAPGADAAWGGDAWAGHVLRVSEQARRLGLRVDLTLGPRWPLASAQLRAGAPGVARELVLGMHRLRPGEPMPQALPRPADADPQRPLRRVAVTAARLVGPAAQPDALLDAASLLDLSARVGPDEQLDWQPPAPGDWAVFALWERPTGQHITGLTAAPAYVVDHFASDGSQAVIRAWDDLLQRHPALRRALRRGGGAFFGDSLELDAQLHWTPDLLHEFERRRGYALQKYLPALFIPGLHSYFPAHLFGHVTPESAPRHELNAGLGAQVRRDYHQTLTELMEERHLLPLRRFAHRLGMQLRYQPAYGAPLDLLSNARVPDIPETEHLFAPQLVDLHRAIASTAQALGRPLVSAECCAAGVTEAYGVLPRDLWSALNRVWAGGVNQVVLHGLAYRDMPGAAAPGWLPFAPIGPPARPLPGVGESFDARQPWWPALRALNDAVARTQWLLRRGRPALDVAWFRQAWWVDHKAAAFHTDPGLSAAGYSHGFVGAALLAAPQARWRQGRLFPDGTGYRALVVDPALGLPDATALGHLARLARAGLPLVWVGEPPEAARLALRAAPHLRVVATAADVTPALRALGVRPALQPLAPVPGLMSARRVDGATHHYLVFNPTPQPLRLDARFEGRGAVWLLDAWSGEAQRWPAEASADGGQRLRLALPPGQARLVRIAVGPAAERAPAAAAADAAVPRTLDGPWTVQPLDLWPAADGAAPIALAGLQDWRGVDALRGRVGRVRYALEFELPAPPGRCEEIDLGDVAGAAIAVVLNGQRLPPFDPAVPRREVSAALRSGANRLEVEFASSLRTRMLVQRGMDLPAWQQPSGLLGPVRLLGCAG